MVKNEFQESKDLIIELLKVMGENGIVFSASGGDGMMNLSPEEIFDYTIDPDCFIARYNNISVEKYKKGKEIFDNIESYYFRCCALKSDKKRCKLEINLKNYYNVIDFTHTVYALLENSGSLCDFHESRIKSGYFVDILPINSLECSNFD